VLKLNGRIADPGMREISSHPPRGRHPLEKERNRKRTGEQNVFVALGGIAVPLKTWLKSKNVKNRL